MPYRQRPPVVTARTRFGDWEGDTLEGGKGAGGLATLVERKSRYLIATRLCDKKAATMTKQAITSFRRTPRMLRENTNGLLRQYFPKGFDFRNVPEKAIAFVVKNLNNRPRKCLNYLTPHEVYRQAHSGAL